MNSGLFRIIHKYKSKIALSGSGSSMKMTIKALQRIGIEADLSDVGFPRIEITDKTFMCRTAANKCHSFHKVEEVLNWVNSI